MTDPRVPLSGNVGPATSRSGGGATARYPSPAEITRRALGGALTAPCAPGSTLLCTEHPGCRAIAAWKLLTANRGRRLWTGRAACTTHLPAGSVAA